MTPGGFAPMITALSAMAPAPRKVQGCPSSVAVAAAWSTPVEGGQGGVRVPWVSGGVTGPVVKQTCPLMIVCGAVLEFVKVLETTPNGAVVPRLGAIWARAEVETRRLAARARWIFKTLSRE